MWRSKYLILLCLITPLGAWAQAVVFAGRQGLTVSEIQEIRGPGVFDRFKFDAIYRQGSVMFHATTDDRLAVRARVLDSRGWPVREIESLIHISDSAILVRLAPVILQTGQTVEARVDFPGRLANLVSVVQLQSGHGNLELSGTLAAVGTEFEAVSDGNIRVRDFVFAGKIANLIARGRRVEITDSHLERTTVRADSGQVSIQDTTGRIRVSDAASGSAIGGGSNALNFMGCGEAVLRLSVR